MPGNMGIIFAGDTQYSSCESGVSHRTHRHFSSGQRLAQQTRIDTSRMRTQIVIPKVVSVGRLEPKLVGLLAVSIGSNRSTPVCSV